MMNNAVCLMLVLGWSVVQAELVGQSDGEYWAYQWYVGEPFRFDCNTSKLNISSANDLKVVWDTPTLKGVDHTHDDNVYKTSDGNGMYGSVLLVKNVQESQHGVYMCHVFDTSNDDKLGMVVYGLNIHEPKYHKAMDKYRHNIIVAVVATAVFFVPLATACFVWKFQYRTEEEKEKMSKIKRDQQYMYNGSEGTEMKHRSPEGIATTVESPEGKGAYENPNTRL